MSGFDRLHPALQHHIVNSLGWRSLRDLQEETIPPVLDGATVLLCAPTAGGKTEAAAFPLLSRMLAEEWRPLSVLYVCPLKALINDLESRLSLYANLLGRRAALWHGDLPQGERRRIREEPPDLLLTTPESIEVMLVSKAAGQGALFRNLRAVVVDELHAFAGDDRGWHLLSVLERAQRFAGRPLQRVGLSATVGNPDSLVAWLAGSTDGPQKVVSVDREEEVDAEVQVDFVGNLQNAARVVSRLYRGEKRLVFVDSRSRVEALAFELRELGVSTFVSHGSLGLEERRAAERAFSEARDCVIVATSTLELGIDVGDLDRVVQIDAPTTVASFLQRLGRTGRRSGSKRNLLFLATREETLLLASAIVHLWRQGFVEPLSPPALPYQILGQQVLALAVQQGGLGREEWREWIGRMPGFSAFPVSDSRTVVDFMLETGLLFEDSGIYGLGPEGDRRFRGKGFLELLSVFSTDPLFTILHGRTEVGRVDEASFLCRGEEGPVLILGGRSWRVTHVDWRERQAWVEPTKIPGRSLWLGSGRLLRWEVCQAIRTVLRDGMPESWFTRRGREALEDARERFRWLPADGTVLQRETANRTRWWTFAGLRANAAIGDHLATSGLTVVSQDSLSIVLGGYPVAGPLKTALRSAEERLDRGEELLPFSLAAEAVKGLKFHFCVPEELNRRCLLKRLADPQGCRQIIAASVTSC